MRVGKKHKKLYVEKENGVCAAEEMMFNRKELIRLMYPLIIEQILAVAVGMADVMMVASVGESAVAGVSLVDSIALLIIQLLAALATGGAVISAQYLGAKDKENACKAAGQLLLFTTLVSTVFMVAALVGNRAILGLLFGRVENAIMENAVIYFGISALSFPFLAIYNACAALYRSMGNSRVSMRTSVLMNGINVAGNALCVFGLKMGVAGVAIPTLVSRAVAALVMLYLIRKKENPIHITSLRQLSWNGAMLRRILYIAVPNGCENSLFQLGKIILQSLVSTMGAAAISGYAVASNLVTLLYLPGNALGLGLITVVAQCVGAGEYKQAKKYTLQIVGVNYALLALVCTVMVLVVQPLVGVYQLGSEAFAIAVRLIVMHAVAMLIWPPSFTLPHALRAAADVRFTMVVSIFSMWAFRIGMSYVLVLGLGMGPEGIWLAMFIDWIFRDCLFIPRFFTGKWLHKAKQKSLTQV